jgi:chemotaxis protein methyltransferase CheR
VTQTTTPIAEHEFTHFQEFFYQKTGIVFSSSKRYFVDRRLTERMAAAGTDTFAAYLGLLSRPESSGTELQNLVNAMTVNETYFDRESYQFRCLVESIMPEVVQDRRPDDTIQVWSMPCSTGEEPYSIAIHLLDGWSDADNWSIRLVATDIDTRVLEQARNGIYDARSIQHVPQHRLERFFTPVGADRWQVVASLRRSVEFRQANISSDADMRGFRGIDVIFCRNLLIYFDDASRRRAIESLYEALRPGGFICLGHSEAMSRMSSLFITRKFPEATVHQKPLPESSRRGKNITRGLP